MESDRHAIIAMEIVFGEINGHKWDWGSMRWIDD